MFRIKKGAIVRNVLLPEVQCVVDRIVVRNTWGSGRAGGGDGGAVIVHLTAEISHAAGDGILFFHKEK